MNKRETMNRREFLGAVGAVGIVGTGRATAAAAPSRRPQGGGGGLNVGLVSDIHVTNRVPGRRDGNEHFLKALRAFDAQKANTVFMAGNLTLGDVVQFVDDPAGLTADMGFMLDGVK